MNNPFCLSDDQLKELLNAFADWHEKNPEEAQYAEEFRERAAQLRKTLLNRDYLAKVRDKQLADETYRYSRTLEGPAYIRLGMPRIEGRLKMIKRNLHYLIDPAGEPFKKAADILEGEHKIEIFAKAFWTPLFQAQYPDTLPNWNNKTTKFLKKVGVNVRTSRLETETKYRMVSEAFRYLTNMDKRQDFFTINHLMHYGTVVLEGVQILDRMLGIKGKQKKEKEVKLPTSMKITSHSEAEFVLLKLGVSLGYDTYSPDKSREAYGQRLGNLITLDDVPQFTIPTLLDTIKNIDVIWFTDDFPICCFEIEHTTGVTHGLLRLYQTSQLNTKLFVIAPADVLKKFEREMNKIPFKKIRIQYIFRSYEDLAKFSHLAENYTELRKKFFRED